MYVSVLLQCGAVCCSVLQCVAVCCSVLQFVAVCCSVLQCVEDIVHLKEIKNRKWHVDSVASVCCSVLQCVAVCFAVCNRHCASQRNHEPTVGYRLGGICVLQCVAVCCSVLQCVEDIVPLNEIKNRKWDVN